MFDNNIAWYYQVWCWVGLGAAIVLLVMLFTTNLLKADINKSRWKDPTWLAWLATVCYLLHNVEEYGIDLTGTLYAFPKGIESMLGLMPGGIFFAAVNISLFWFAGPIAAILSRKYHIMSMGMMGIILINSIAHLAPFILTGKYNAGLFTAIILFIPYTIWTIYSCFGKGKFKLSVLGVVIGTSLITHAILFVSIMILLRNGIVGIGIVTIFQVFTAILLLLLWYGAEKMQ